MEVAINSENWGRGKVPKLNEKSKKKLQKRGGGGSKNRKILGKLGGGGKVQKLNEKSKKKLEIRGGGSSKNRKILGKLRGVARIESCNKFGKLGEGGYGIFRFFFCKNMIWQILRSKKTLGSWRGGGNYCKWVINTVHTLT